MSNNDPILNAVFVALADGVDDFYDLVDHLVRDGTLPVQTESFGRRNEIRVRRVIDDCPVLGWSSTDRIVRLDLLADGLTFTHRLTAAELEAGAVAFSPDLVGLDLDRAQLLFAGSAVTYGSSLSASSAGAWSGPAGWLNRFSVGDLIAVRRRGVELEVEAVADVTEGIQESNALLDAMRGETADLEERGVEIESLVGDAVMNDPDLFRIPTRPVGELLDGIGVDIVGQWAGWRGVDWAPPGVILALQVYDQIVERHQLPECCADALDTVIEHWYLVTGRRESDPRAARQALAHGGTVYSFAEWSESLFGLHSDTVHVFAESLIERPRRDSAAALTLRSMVYEDRDETLTAEVDLEEAITLDPEYQPALAELARYAADRSNLTRAALLLTRSGAPSDHPLAQTVARLETRPLSAARNDPCPCGSGRKFKQCHLGRQQMSPSQMIEWLLFKLHSFVYLRGRVGALYALATGAFDLTDPEQVEMIDDDFLVELRMFEDGGVEEYVASRQSLLPRGEIDVLDMWSVARLALWEVADKRGAVVTMRDTRTGETLDVTDRATARAFEIGEQLLARVLSGWGSNWMSGVALRIDGRHRGSVLNLLDNEPTAADIARWFAELRRPPSLQTSEGEEFQISVARLHALIPWDRLAERLDELFTQGDVANLWHDSVEQDEEEFLIRATLAREGNELRVTTYSQERLDRVLARLGDLVEVADVDIRPLPIGRSPHAAPAAPIPDPVEFDMAPLQDKMEQNWLSESIPMFGGLTPHEAVADPTRREDVITLLRSMERLSTSAGAITMRPEVLRRHLGLD